MANSAWATEHSAGIVVPLRSFVLGKGRLAPALDPDARAALAQAMAARVVDAAGARPIAVISSAPDVRAWASELGVDVVDDPGTLDTAAATGREWASARNLVRYAIVHADLPLITASAIDAVLDDGEAPVAVVVPDHRDDGTPVLSLPVATPFTFAYGPGSAARHVDEARRRGLDVRIIRDHALSFDVDTPADLAALQARRP